MRSGLFVGLCLAGIACSRDVTVSGTPLTQQNVDLPSPVSPHGVTVFAGVAGRVAGGDSVAIQLFNAGSDTAYAPRCGPGPLLLVRQFVNGAWVGGVQNFACVVSATPGPVPIAPGATVALGRTLQAGRYQMIVSIASRVDLSDAIMAYSRAFDAP